MRDFLLALKFSFSHYSIFPISFKKSDDLSKKEILALMITFFPLVGLIIGLVIVGLHSLLLSKFGLYGAIFSAIFYMVLYGFIHTEAIIDVVDAIYAKLGGKDSYKVIKEPTVGAMGVLYAFSFILLKVTFTVYLLQSSLFAEFLSILIVSRFGVYVVIYISSFKSSFITALKGGLRVHYVIYSLIVYLLIGSYITIDFILFMLYGVILALLISKLLHKMVGFINGDILGATLELVELIILFTTLAISYR
ncbi:MAG: hypothetical protein GXO06_04870 [Epsilonproteobacteria bacterium]|nr:hypothetical protein [Campylobacterota bacterium]